jgi:hypothetical protein
MIARPIPTLFVGLCLLVCAACSRDGLGSEPLTRDDLQTSAHPDQSHAGDLSEAERLDIARDIVSLQHDPSTFDLMLQQLSPRTAMSARPVDVERCEALSSPERRERCIARAKSLEDGRATRAAAMKDQLRSVYEDSLDDLAAMMARTYTDEELTGILDFYRSPAGQGMLNKQPQIAAEFMSLLTERARVALKPDVKKAAPSPAPTESEATSP